ncbi:hypothetical protein GCM10009106_13850 [Sphingomonas japonica]
MPTNYAIGQNPVDALIVRLAPELSRVPHPPILHRLLLDERLPSERNAQPIVMSDGSANPADMGAGQEGASKQSLRATRKADTPI